MLGECGALFRLLVLFFFVLRDVPTARAHDWGTPATGLRGMDDRAIYRRAWQLSALPFWVWEARAQSVYLCCQRAFPFTNSWRFEHF